MNTIIRKYPFEFQITDKGKDIYEVKVLKKPISIFQQLQSTLLIVVDPSPPVTVSKRKSFIEQLREQLNL